MRRPLLLLALAAGCPAPEGDPTTTDPSASVDEHLVGVSVRPFDPTLTVGAAQPFTARAHFADDRSVDLAAGVSWISEDAHVLTVSSDGTVQAQAPGTASVVATYEGFSGKVDATVRAPDDIPTEVALTPATLSLAPGERAQLRAVATFGDGSTGEIGGACGWSTEHPERVTVDDQGEVTALAAGRSEVRADCADLPRAASLITISEDPTDRPLPDLAVGAFTVQVEGSRATWEIAVDNDGDGYAQGFWVDLFLDLAAAPTLDDDLLDIGWVPGLGAGERVTLTLTTPDLAPGSYASWVTVDLDGRVPETNEANNVAGPAEVVVSADAPLPDLVIADLEALADETHTLYEVLVTNEGAADASGFWVDLFLDAPTDPPLHAIGDTFTWVESLAAGESVSWTPLIADSPGAGGAWSSVVFADITARVEESDETNNLARVTVAGD